jgi:hypothetical protein
MNVYIWKRIDQATTNYHSEGGVVAIAATEERARQLAEASEEGCRFGENEKPDVVQAVADGAPEFVYIFQDAGCC